MRISPTSLDHVALWVEERDPLADFLCRYLSMHVIEQTDSFTLVGVDAKLGKVTLFDAKGPRERGALEQLTLRVQDLDAAAEGLPPEARARHEDGVVTFDAPQGLRMGLVPGDGPDYDLDHVVLRVPEPAASARALTGLGFERRDGTVAVADRHVRLEPGGRPEGERPLLNHLALLVDSASETQGEAERAGIEIAEVKDAANTLAVFVWGPDRIKLEYVEHKPGFALI